MNVTKHAKERWLERVNPNAEQNAEKEIVEGLGSAKFIWEHEGRNFWIDENFIIYVVQPRDQVVITVYKVDYGFPEDINVNIAKELLEKIDKQRQYVDDIKEKQENRRTKNKIAIEKHQLEIDTLQTKIEQQNAKIKEIEANNQTMDLELITEQKIFDNLAYQLSVTNFKVERLAGVK